MSLSFKVSFDLSDFEDDEPYIISTIKNNGNIKYL